MKRDQWRNQTQMMTVVVVVVAVDTVVVVHTVAVVVVVVAVVTAVPVLVVFEDLYKSLKGMSWVPKRKHQKRRLNSDSDSDSDSDFVSQMRMRMMTSLVFGRKMMMEEHRMQMHQMKKMRSQHCPDLDSGSGSGMYV